MVTNKQPRGVNDTPASGLAVPEASHDIGQVDAHTIRAREAERAELRADIDAFLANGGAVTEVDPELRVDLPRKPANNYGKGTL